MHLMRSFYRLRARERMPPQFFTPQPVVLMARQINTVQGGGALFSRHRKGRERTFLECMHTVGGVLEQLAALAPALATNGHVCLAVYAGIYLGRVFDTIIGRFLGVLYHPSWRT